MKISKISNQLPSETRPIKRWWKPQSGRRSSRPAMLLPSRPGLRGECHFGFAILDSRSRPSLAAYGCDAPVTTSLLKPPASDCQPVPAARPAWRDLAVAPPSAVAEVEACPVRDRRSALIERRYNLVVLYNLRVA